MKPTTLYLEGMSFTSGHGCYDIERKVKGRFTVDVEIDTDASLAVEQDRIEGTVDYVAVYQTIRRQMEVTSALVEHVAGRIVRALREQFPQALEVRVKVSKIAPPVGGKIDRVAVRVSG